MIKDDVEIQNWIGEVKRHGFTYADDAEIPQVHGWQLFLVNIFMVTKDLEVISDNFSFQKILSFQ